jgi:glucose-6-phosphate 1-dehydrogenase
MIQNHLLQLLCITAMEPPVNLDIRSVRDETVKVLAAVAVEPIDSERDAVRGQYDEGIVGGAKVCGYRDEEAARENSTTATSPR